MSFFDVECGCGVGVEEAEFVIVDGIGNTDKDGRIVLECDDDDVVVIFECICSIGSYIVIYES